MNRLFVIFIFCSFTICIWTSCDKSADKKINGSYVLSRMKVDLKKPLGENFVFELNEKIYNEVINGNLKAYKNDSLNSIYTSEELIYQGATENLIVVTPDSSYTEYTYDSIILSIFESSMIVSNLISKKWIHNKANNTFTGKLNAFSITHNLKVEGIVIPDQPLFWIKYNDLKKVTTKEKFAEITDVIFISMTDLISEY